MRIADYPREHGIDLSLVIPVYNETESLDALFAELKSTLGALAYTWEIVFIDDGSFDGSFEKLLQIQADCPQVGVVQFRRNFGQTAALSAGFDFAHGNIIITMDADLQNDPADIAVLLAKLDEGYDIVSGWRHARQDSWLNRKLPSKIANWLISRLTKVALHDYGCTLKAYRREVVKNLNLYGELHRFIPALANERGARVTEVKVNHRRRQFGRSKYTLSRTSRVLLDLANVKFLLEYRTRPIQFFGKLGLLSLFGGGLMFTGAVAMKLFANMDLTGNPMLLTSLILFVAGIQLISTGLIGELVTRAYYENQGKPIYTVKTVVQPNRGALDDKTAAGLLGDVEV
ncbi:MAG: glycosyltransferase family 2 protein [Actinomycetota bacterium]|nr:glycosyltransferase family 2 protein [Actinomycetota bacterium]